MYPSASQKFPYIPKLSAGFALTQGSSQSTGSWVDLCEIIRFRLDVASQAAGPETLRILCKICMVTYN